ncbi:uncharacterized protein A4U43_C10F11970 [Asparagus officinalis]|uniref:Zinc finger PHD-type domain-containing protein n=1 Tax=Asparagus officinalis TaxID=4686 RepID=A0A5P1E279_ASPOF|nr:uncharacterized protein A4U43_C10F11970 [Asparagus officinalis]
MSFFVCLLQEFDLPRCMSCKYEMTAADFDEWAYRQLEDSSHLLHGVVHANGYGHLLRINGREGGSKHLTGCDVMGFWDRLCKMLHVRKVTVMDISKKYGMEYRLLHAVTAGHPWYGDWGYEFGAGSYALTSQAYQKAVDTLSNMPLSFLFSHSRSLRTPVQNTVSLYWSLADRKLETVRDLFCYVTYLLHKSHENPSQSETNLRKNLKDDATRGILCAWGKHDIERAEEVMVKVLRAVGGSRWVTWKSLRGAACRAVASPELLDYCLKGLAHKVTNDGMHVAVRCNPDNNAIEYRLETGPNKQCPKENVIRPSADQLLHDLKFLYDALLNPTTMQSYKPDSIRQTACSSAAKLLDCKRFIKNYEEPISKTRPLNPFSLRIWCHVELVNQPKDYIAPPPELLILPATATVADLKLHATKAFQDTYLIFEKFQAEELVDHGDVDDCIDVRLLVGANESIKVRGRCFGDEYRLGQFRMERGLENWTVDCACGAKDDDGERMLACDSCGVWQHTRCAGISDLHAVPVKFVCRKCSCASKSKARSGGKGKANGRYKVSTSNGNKRCKDEVAAPAMDGRAYGRMTTVG